MISPALRNSEQDEAKRRSFRDYFKIESRAISQQMKAHEYVVAAIDMNGGIAGWEDVLSTYFAMELRVVSMQIAGHKNLLSALQNHAGATERLLFQAHDKIYSALTMRKNELERLLGIDNSSTKR